MNIYEGGYIYETTSNEYISQVEHEKYLPSLLTLDFDVLYKYFKGDTILPVFRIFALRADESIDYEISRDVMNANLNISAQSGQRQSLNITLVNTENRWEYSARGNLWVGMKFRFDIGVVIGNTLYWQQQGVFILNEPTPSIDGSKHTISLSLCDKWGIWDGAVYGNTRFKTIIPTQVPMRQAFDTIIHEDNGLGNMWDIKPVRFNTAHWETLTYYTIKQDAGQPKSQPLLDMAKTISSDIYYDRHGYCNVESNLLDFISGNFPIAWKFSEGDADCGNVSLKYNRSNYYNSKLRDRLLQSYRYYTNKDNNPSQTWTEMESEAFWELFKDYEKRNGNGFMHEQVKPAMLKLTVVEHRNGDE